MKATDLKLKTRILILTTLAFFVVATIGFIYTAKAVFEHTQKTLLQQQSLLQNLLVEQIDNILQSRLESLQLISNDLHDGQALLDVEHLQKALNSHPMLHREFNGGLIVMNADARMIVDSPIVPGRVGTDLSDREHAKQVKLTKKPVITNPLIGRGLKSPIYATSVPILANNGDFLGYLLGITRLDSSNPITTLNQELNNGSGNLYVVDLNNNIFVTSTRLHLAMQPLPRPDESEILRRVTAGDKQGLAQSFFDEYAYFSAQKLKNMDWHVVHTLPRSLLNIPIWALFKELIILSIAGIFIFLGLLYWLLRNQLIPLERGAQTINQMLKGEIPDSVLPVYRNDEVGVLINAFNQKIIQLDEEASSQIRELTDNFTIILENTSDFIYFKDASGRMKFCSQSLVELTQHTNWFEIQGKLDTELFPAEFAKIYAEEDEIVYKRGLSVIKHVAPYQRKDGKRGWVQTNKWPVLSSDGASVIGLFGISRDITKQVQLENSYQNTIKVLKQAEALAKICSWTIDLTTNKIFWSDEASNILEVDIKKTATSYDSFLEIVHPDDRKLVQTAFHNSIRNKAKYAINYRLLMTDGRIKHVEEHGEPAYYDGAPRYSNGTIQDISERWQAEQQLRIAACVFDSQEGMLVTDLNGTILRVNNAFTEITGYCEVEAIGQNPRILNSGRQPRSFYKSMWDSIKTKGRWEGEVWNRRKDGNVYPEYLRITAVKNERGDRSHYVGTIVDITQSKAAAEQIEFLGFYDPLTELPNRRLLFDRLNHAVVTCKRNGCYGAILFIDLDNFKILNDTHGHATGDLLLQQVASRLIAALREGDTVSRIGGDEFIVLLEDLSDEPVESAIIAETVAKKIHSQLNLPYTLDSLQYTINNSIGMSLFGQEELDGDDIIKQADIAMYQAKLDGKNGIRFFDPLMQEKISARDELHQELKKAIDLKQLELYYQIQVNSNGDAIGAEALIRWNHPEKGLISPINFISLAEETQLIIPLGQLILEAACEQLVKWSNNTVFEDLVLSVNVSAVEFRQTNFTSRILKTLEHYNIAPSRIKLELTESLLIDSADDVIDKMQTLSLAGINFSLDDFGTGYSSLYYLKRLPISQLKIDQSFVKDLKDDSSDQTIVKTIINMAHGLGIDVIAEGVEDQSQKDFLQHHGCDNYQGYLFGKPLPAQGFELLLTKAIHS